VRVLLRSLTDPTYPAESIDSSITASIKRALMPPLEDSPGVRLLKKMGWRPGQGVGPRVSWRSRKIQDLLAAGKSINGVDIDALDDDEEAKRHLYPPRDTVVPRFSMKSDPYGLGYTAAPGLVESLGQKRPASKGPKLAGEWSRWEFGSAVSKTHTSSQSWVWSWCIERGRRR
jgi:G patch domain-containing protein 1